MATMVDFAPLLDRGMFVHYRKPRDTGMAPGNIPCALSPNPWIFSADLSRTLMSRATPQDDRREIARRMHETLVQAKVGLAEMREALEKARARLASEERELETVRRRRQLAQDIGDTDTVNVGAKYESTHAERVGLLRKKVVIQEDEVRLAEVDVETMTADLRAASSGTGDFAPHVPTTVISEDQDDDAPLASEIDRLGRNRARAERHKDAELKLEELKRRMGK